MNDWYIDRSKNFINDTLDKALTLFNTACKTEISSDLLAEKIKESGALGGAEGNPNAALTRFRDHGFLRKNNTIGDSAQDYIEGRLGKAELIIDMFSKRPAMKSSSPDVKPFYLLCLVFDSMLQMGLDPDDIFLTYEECREYLYPIISYSGITFELVEKIVSEREYEYGIDMPKPRITLEPNEDTNLSIWFNALRETPVFMPLEVNKRVLRPNLKQAEFFHFMAVNADELKPVPTSSNNSLYDYYCDSACGLSEILPNVIRKESVFDKEEDAQTLFQYLFGFKKIAAYNYSRYIKYNCFGLFFPFITLPKLVIREIWKANQIIGNGLYQYVVKGQWDIESINIDEFEYKGFYGETKTVEAFSFDSTIPNACNLVIYGTPGCGKSFYVENTLLKEYEVEKDLFIRTTFYQDYTNTDFVGQVLPKVKSDKSVTYEFNPGPFTLALKKAIENQEKPVALIIEELNRGNAASIFGDIFQLLDRNESGKSRYKIINPNIQDYFNEVFEGKYFFDSIRIPGNLYIIATMNTSDQNVFTLDTAFKRRWNFEKIKNIFTADHKYRQFYIPGMPDVTWEQFVTDINEFIVNSESGITSEDKQLGVFFIDKGTLCEKKEECTDKQKIEKFAYKIFEYLWDDVAKFGHGDWFASDIKTLDDLIEEYQKRGKAVFVDGVLSNGSNQ